MEPHFPQIKTKRLILRSPRLSDAGQYHELLSIAEVTKLTDIPHSPTHKRSERFVSWMSKLFSRGKGCAWIITRRESNELIGAIRINEINKRMGYGEIGYELNPQHWNRGLMSEAVSVITECGHKEFNLNRIEAWVVAGNSRSEKVLAKNGYEYEGTLRQRLCLRGKFCDLKMFSHLRTPKHAGVSRE